MTILFSSSIYSNNLPNYLEKSDSLKILEKYSLFSEYHKNKDFFFFPTAEVLEHCDTNKANNYHATQRQKYPDNRDGH